MRPLPIAIDRGDVAQYVEALSLVYLVLIFIRVLLSWVPRMPYNRVLRALVTFVEETTDPYLNIFRRVIPPIGGRLDISPIVAILVLSIVSGIIVRLIAGVSPPGARSRGRAWLLAGLVALATIVCDQIAKAAVRSGLEPGERVDLIFGFDLTRVSNSGIAFGLFEDLGPLVPVITVAALVAVIVWFALAPGRPGLWLAVGLLTGGALGNLIDRLRDSAVTDFLDPPLWPAFNVADIAVTLGAFTLALVALRVPAAKPDTEENGSPP